jgi:hypothetical protein
LKSGAVECNVRGERKHRDNKENERVDKPQETSSRAQNAFVTNTRWLMKVAKSSGWKRSYKLDKRFVLAKRSDQTLSEVDGRREPRIIQGMDDEPLEKNRR